MKRREAKKEIEKILAESIVEEQIFQLRPWTCYLADVIVSRQAYRLLGFTKVRYPDEWEAAEGVNRAKKKALSLCAKKIMLWFSFHWDCPQEVCPWELLIGRWVDDVLAEKPLAQRAYAEATAEMEKRYGFVRIDFMRSDDCHSKGLQ